MTRRFPILRPRPLASIAVCTAIALAALADVTGSAQPASSDPVADRLLRGALDVHAHIDPDSFGPNSNQAARLIDVDELAQLARKRGMRGFVAKMHYDTTAHVAYLLRKAVPGIEVFGLLGSNRAMGGVNPAAVAHMAEVKGGWGRIVNMPTWDAEFYVKNSNNPNRPYVSVSRNGELLPEVKEVIAIMAKTRTRDSNGQMVLYTGHNSPEESVMMVLAATRAGVPVMVSHPMIEFINMPADLMQEAAKAGGYLEIVSNFISGANSAESIEKHVQIIRKIGVDRFILSSDRGQAKGPPHADALIAAAKVLISHGFTEGEVSRMMKDNPARMMGLSPPPAGSR